MATAVGSNPVILRKAKLAITSATFASAGDIIDATVNAPNLVLANYTRRHVALTGGFTVSFPGSQEPSEAWNTGGVWPTRPSYQLTDSEMRATATADGSVFYCVMPIFSRDQLNVTRVSLSPGQTHLLDLRSVGFVFGDSYQVNGEAKTQNQVFACENSTATIQAVHACQIIVFSVAA